MVKIVVFACSVLMAQTSFAATIIWEAAGEILRLTDDDDVPPFVIAPPVGTPYTLQFQFDPTNVSPTPFAPAGSNCLMTPVTGQFTLGGYSMGVSGFGFTNAVLTADNCDFFHKPFLEGETQFFFGLDTPDPEPWTLTAGPTFLLASYQDQLLQDAFPVTPTPFPSGSLLFHNDWYEFSGGFNPRLVDQSTAVPEPGTLALMGMGLAYTAARRRRRV